MTAIHPLAAQAKPGRLPPVATSGRGVGGPSRAAGPAAGVRSPAPSGAQS